MHNLYPHTIDDLPESYNDSRIVLLVRDPHCLYAYWEISESKKIEFDREYGHELWQNSVPALKISNVSKNSSFFIRINDFNDNWYINIPESNASFIAEFGRLLPGGSFVSLISSNTATVRDLDASSSSSVCFTDYMAVRNGDVNPDSVKILEAHSASQESSYIFGISTSESPDIEMRDYTLNAGSNELMRMNILKHLGVSSHNFTEQNTQNCSNN